MAVDRAVARALVVGRVRARAVASAVAVVRVRAVAVARAMAMAVVVTPAVAVAVMMLAVATAAVVGCRSCGERRRIPHIPRRPPGEDAVAVEVAMRRRSLWR